MGEYGKVAMKTWFITYQVSFAYRDIDPTAYTSTEHKTFTENEI
jgi:hypothetical protein